MEIGNYTVHVVDDEEPIRKSLAFLLATAGFTVRLHESATAFLAATTSGLRNACLVTDLRMPDMSGVELLCRLQQRDTRLPAIVITGHGDVPMAVNTMKKGAMDFIQKPFKEEELVGLVERMLDHAKGAFAEFQSGPCTMDWAWADVPREQTTAAASRLAPA